MLGNSKGIICMKIYEKKNGKGGEKEIIIIHPIYYQILMLVDEITSNISWLHASSLRRVRRKICDWWLYYQHEREGAYMILSLPSDECACMYALKHPANPRESSDEDQQKVVLY